MANQLKFDGMDVHLYEGKFSGGFDLSEDVGESLQYDDEVAFLVRTRLDSASFKETKNGDVRRINSFSVLGIDILDDAIQDRLIQVLGEEFANKGEDDPQMNIYDYPEEERAG